MIKVYMLVVVLGLVGGVVYGGYYYYKDTQSRIQTLTENSAKLETAKKVQDQTIATLVADAKKYEELNKDLNTRLNAANKYKNKLLGKLRKINLKKLSAEEPAVWEEKINNASKSLLESFESITVVPDIK
jgi:N-methylhydantoinase B/oxoprolinase/acetone carboxylase alpha subunit|tara:strand:- start:330 stop:719 length:390 start_codon:yes stop_codon:yes gene_type:complete